MIHIQALEDDLGDDKISVLLLQLYLLKELQKLRFGDGALAVSFGGQSWHNLLIIGGNELGDLNEHFLLLLLLLDLIIRNQLPVGLDNGPFIQLFILADRYGIVMAWIGQFCY